MKDIDLGKIQTEAELIMGEIRTFLQKDGDKKVRAKKGGYLCIADRKGKALALFMVGSVANETNASMYHGYAHEKAIRLGIHPNHFSSWQSREAEVGCYGGAIRTDKYILSFSGLPEHWDEAFVMRLASRLKLFRLSAYAINTIWGASGNPHITASCSLVA